MRNFLKDRMLWFLLLIVKRFLRREIDLDNLYLSDEVYSLNIHKGLLVLLEFLDDGLEIIVLLLQIFALLSFC